MKGLLSLITKLIKWLFSHRIRYSKIVTTALYLFMFAVIVYTLWTFYYARESVNPEVYAETIKTLCWLLGITGGLKISENISNAAETVAQYKYTGADLRGGE